MLIAFEQIGGAEAALTMAPHGLLLNAPRPNLLRFMPALNVSEAEIDQMIDALDILLKKSFERTRYDTAALDALTDGLGWTVFDRRHYLTYMAFKAHEMLESQTERRDEAALVGEDELVDEILKPYFRENLGLAVGDARRRAQDFVALMVDRSGLLTETPGGFRLGDHLTMQEFLAGFYLAENYADEDPEGYAAFFREKARQTWWREVVLLAAGYLGQKPGFKGQKFLRRLVEAGSKQGQNHTTSSPWKRRKPSSASSRPPVRSTTS